MCVSLSFNADFILYFPFLILLQIYSSNLPIGPVSVYLAACILIRPVGGTDNLQI